MHACISSRLIALCSRSAAQLQPLTCRNTMKRTPWPSSMVQLSVLWTRPVTPSNGPAWGCRNPRPAGSRVLLHWGTSLLMPEASATWLAAIASRGTAFRLLLAVGRVGESSWQKLCCVPRRWQLGRLSEYIVVELVGLELQKNQEILSQQSKSGIMWSGQFPPTPRCMNLLLY